MWGVIYDWTFPNALQTTLVDWCIPIYRGGCGQGYEPKIPYLVFLAFL